MSQSSQIKQSIENGNISFSVFGLGYVGLPIIVSAYHNSPQINVIGVDVSKKKLELLNNGISYVDDISDDEISNILEKGFKVTDDGITAVSKTSISIICVPTPVDDFGNPQLDYIKNAGDSIAQSIKQTGNYQLIVLESTTYPTTTEIVLKQEFEKYGLILGKHFDLCFSPERIDPGNTTYQFSKIPKVLGSTSSKSLDLAKQFYEEIIGVNIVTASSPRVAEMTKLFENIFRQVNIALVNELAVLSEKMGIDVYEVINLAATKPFGFMPHYPGPGLGGHCIPVDPYYLSYIAKQYKFRTKFVDLASEINDEMVTHTVKLIKIALNRVGKSISNSKIVFAGFTYKPNISDTRNSPAIPITHDLKQLGAEIYVLDRHVDEETIGHPVVEFNDIKTDLDLIVVMTPHSYFDFNSILLQLQEDQPLVDTRGVYDPSQYRKHDIALGRPIRELGIKD